MESGRSFTSQGTSQGTELSSMGPKVMGAIDPDAFFQHPRRLSRIRKWNIAKVVFYTLCFGIAFCIVCMDAYVYPNISYFSPFNPYQFSLPFALVSALWCAAELVTIVVRRDIGRGIKPAWHVGVGLILWMECLAMAIMSVVMNSSYYYYYYREFTDYGTKQLLQNGGRLLCVLFCFLGAFHFGLFVRACIEVDHAKSERHIARVFKEITQLNLQRGTQQQAASDQQQQQQQQQQRPQSAEQDHDANPTQQPLETAYAAQPQIPRRPVGAPPADSRDKDSGACRIIDPDVEANLKFIAPFPIYASQGNLKYPQTAMKG